MPQAISSPQVSLPRLVSRPSSSSDPLTAPLRTVPARAWLGELPFHGDLRAYGPGSVPKAVALPDGHTHLGHGISLWHPLATRTPGPRLSSPLTGPSPSSCPSSCSWFGKSHSPSSPASCRSSRHPLKSAHLTHLLESVTKKFGDSGT